MRRLTALAFLTVALVGCGGASSADDGGEQQRIRATLQASDRAVQAGDFARMCGLLTEPAQREQAKHGINENAKTCADAFDASKAVLDEEDGFQVVGGLIAVGPTAAEITDIDIDGDTAEVRYKGDETTRMRKVDGRWLIDG